MQLSCDVDADKRRLRLFAPRRAQHECAPRLLSLRLAFISLAAGPIGFLLATVWCSSSRAEVFDVGVPVTRCIDYSLEHVCRSRLQVRIDLIIILIFVMQR